MVNFLPKGKSRGNHEPDNLKIISGLTSQSARIPVEYVAWPGAILENDRLTTIYERLANQIRDALRRDRGIEGKKMFGGLGYLPDGK